MTYTLDHKSRLLDEHHDRHEMGHEEGETCGRYPEPDEDQPRRFRPKPCDGVMELDVCGCCVCCSVCGEIGFGD